LSAPAATDEYDSDEDSSFRSGPKIQGKERDEIYARLGDIEQLVKRLDSERSADRDNIFVDPQDRELFADAKLQTPKTVDINTLAPHEFVAWRFGNALLKALCKSDVLPNHISPPTLVLASALPRNQYQLVAFRNSFFYDESDQLYVRKERLQNMGGFVLVLVNVLSHLSANVGQDNYEWDDRDPEFQKAFMSCLRALCSDLVMARAYRPLQLTADDVDNTGSWSSLVPAVRQDAVDRLMDLYPAEDQELFLDTPFLNREKMLHRLEDYKYFHQGAELGQVLLNMESSAAQRDQLTEDAVQSLFDGSSVNYDLAGAARWADVERTSVDINEAMLGDVSDSLNADLISVVTALREAVVAEARMSARKNDPTVGSAAMVELNEAIKHQQLLIEDLDKRKESLLERLKEVERAEQEFSA
jgi:uncharacterized coiled-coil protein SlyX